MSGRLTREQLEALVDKREPEGTRLEFKEEPPPSNATIRLEFLKDVCAMANAEGGRIIIGITESSHHADGFKSVASADRVVMRLLDWCIQNVTEPLAALDIYAAEARGSTVVVVDVPLGHRKPHAYSEHGRAQHKIRVGDRIRDLTDPEIKEMIRHHNAPARPIVATRVAVLQTVVALLALLLMTVPVIVLDHPQTAVSEAERDESWWTRFGVETMIGMPAVVAVGISVVMVIMLMIVTHLIESRNEEHGNRSSTGDRASWLASTVLILAVVVLGVFYGLQPRFGAARYGLIAASAIVTLLFTVDGIPKGRALRALP